MPGHKGKNVMGCEESDITEINGADVLYHADGIIAESENNASQLFDTAHTFYSTEGSSLSIKAMLALTAYDNNATVEGQKPLVLAARNVHKSFVYACALLDLDVEFMYSTDPEDHLCKCLITPQTLKNAIGIAPYKPCAVYVTSPDYLGNTLDIKALAEICHSYGIPLLVDNAHGAYLAFTEPSMHPIKLGADMCCDSAHKTLPALTGAGYLHISNSAPKAFLENARTRLSLFASTSPSYLILQSLDICNKYISEEIRNSLKITVKRINTLKEELSSKGYTLCGNEPLKITIKTAASGINGNDLAAILRKNGVESEYSDSEYLVLMLSPNNTEAEISLLRNTLLSTQTTAATPEDSVTHDPVFPLERKCSIRKAIFAPHETVSVANSVGRICASPTVSCPPAVPIAISGEVITEQAAELFSFYGIDEIDVLK